MLMQRVSFLVVGLAVLGLAAAACSPAVVDADTMAPEGAGETITVTGLGRARGTPDMASIAVGVNVSNEDVGAAVEESNEVMTRLTELLGEHGVAPEDIQTTNFSIWSEGQWDPQTSQPREQRLYRVESTLQLTVRDIDKLGEILETAISNGANNVHGLSFSMQESEPLAQEARVAALRDARQRAEQIATELGASIGDVVRVNEVSGGNIVPSYEIARGLGGGGEPPISEGAMSVTISTEVTYELIH